MSKMLPWAMVAFMTTIIISGLIGLTIGYNMAENGFQEERLQQVKMQNQALDEKDARLRDALSRNQQLEAEFLASIDELNANYKQLSAQMADELKQEVYTQCHVPETGHELLKRRVSEANKRK